MNENVVTFDYDIESAQCSLSSAIKNLYIVKEAIESSLLILEKEGCWGASYLLDCCDALSVPFYELGRISDEMDAAVTAAYTKGKK